MPLARSIDWTDGSAGGTPLSGANLDLSFQEVANYADGLVAEVVPSAFTGAAIEAAIASLGATGGTVALRPGTYLVGSPITVPSSVTLVGAGQQATSLQASGTNTVLRFNGASGSNRCRRSGMRALNVTGNGQTIARLVEMVYADRLYFYECQFNSVVGAAVYAVDLWDSRFENCRFNNGGATGVPAVLMRSTDTGSTPADSINNVHFTGCVWETFTGGGLWIEKNGGVSPSVNRIHECKFESTVATGPFVRLGTSHYSQITHTRLHLAAGSTGGYNVCEVNGYYIVVDHLTITSSGTVAMRTGLQIGTGAGTTGWSTIDNVDFDLTTAPTVAGIELVNSPVNLAIGRCASGVGTLFSGTGTFAPGRPIRNVAGAVTDASFFEPPLSGTLAVDTTNNRLYVRVGTTWRFVGLT